MKKIGFDEKRCNKILQCISTSTSVVLINGSPDKFFKPSRWLRQGDPLSPCLFLFCMEALSRNLLHAEDLGIITGLKICKAAPLISDLLFADDCMIFCKANLTEAQNIMKILQIFGSTSGQLINFNKSKVFFSKNTNPDLIPQISSSMGVQILQLDEKYLGSPLFTHISKISSFNPGVEKLKVRLTSWKNTPLNPAGREILIKSVTSSACIYQMNRFKVQKKTCKDINNLQRDFFWGKNIENPTGYYPKAWTAVCKPKEPGGLAFMNMELFNSSMIKKIGWRLEKDQDSMWYKLMDAKYLLGRNVLNMDTKAKNGDSWNFPHNVERLESILLPDGNWDVDQILTLFSNDKAAVIVNLQTHPNEEDRVIWDLNDKDVFSVKELYKAKIEDLYSNDIPTGNWASIWNMKVAPVIRIFLWKCGQGILPTNAKTASILHYINPSCTVCNNGEAETMSHMWLNCPAAILVWKEVLGSINSHFDSNTIFIEWLTSWFQPGINGTNCNIYVTTCWLSLLSLGITSKYALYKTLKPLFYTALIMTDFAGNITRTKGHPGYNGAEGATAGEELAFQWAKELQHTNVTISAEAMETLVQFKLLHHKAVTRRFHLSYHARRNCQQEEVERSSNMGNYPVSFVFLSLSIITRQQNMDAFNLALFCKNNAGRISSTSATNVIPNVVYAS
ncbi:uncharacterized protein LOC113339503 [Papaver somniferum]|uniref:uncharacterized protein LOC113339503 n=1 Tax=Papaver somniferum TaxID=3469 RepID=UPI000E6FB7E5|nr:uncharacterized protein LOC113339503 [Papaver somniferum]